MVCSDWMEQQFQLNAVMTGKTSRFWYSSLCELWEASFLLSISTDLGILLWMNVFFSFLREYNVDGIPVRPTWIPFVSRTFAEDQIDFDLRLMTGMERMTLMRHLSFQMNYLRCLGL